MSQRFAIIQVQCHQKKVEKEAVRSVFHVSRRAGTLCLNAPLVYMQPSFTKTASRKKWTAFF